MKGLERRALIFAKRAHESVGQVRKYTGDPYIVHPTAVAHIVKSVPGHTAEMVASAYLHDVVEDTGVPIEAILTEFGSEVAELVGWLTDVSKPADGAREQRKAIDRAHSAAAPDAAQTIKVADLIDNTRTIKSHDPDFWKVYRREKLLLLDVLTRADRGLVHLAREMCE